MIVPDGVCVSAALTHETVIDDFVLLTSTGPEAGGEGASATGKVATGFSCEVPLMLMALNSN